MSGGRFQPGQSGNPAGRPKGASKAAEARALLLDAVPDAINTLKKAAAGGDVKAATELLRLALPPLKPVDAPSPIELDPSGRPTDHVAAVLAALAGAELSAGQAAELLAVIAGAGKAAESARSSQSVGGALSRVRRLA